MSVKHALLSLLEQEPMYGYQLRQEFETRTGGTWPLNVGQVYTTLTRLERVSTRMSPQTSSGEAWPAARRISARSRASNSSMLKGLDT